MRATDVELTMSDGQREGLKTLELRIWCTSDVIHAQNKQVESYRVRLRPKPDGYPSWMRGCTDIITVPVRCSLEGDDTAPCGAARAGPDTSVARRAAG